MRQRRGEGFALIVAAPRLPLGTERDRHEHRARGRPLDQLCHGRRHIAAHPRQSIVFQGMDGSARAAVEPHRRAGCGERFGPFAAQPAGTEMRLGLPAALAPRPAHRAPAQATDSADEIVGELGTEEAVAHQTLGGEEQLLEGAEEGGHHLIDEYSGLDTEGALNGGAHHLDRWRFMGEEPLPRERPLTH